MKYLFTIVIFFFSFPSLFAQETLFMGFTHKEYLEDPSFEYGLERKITKNKVEAGDVKIPFEKYLLVHRRNKGKKRYFESLQTDKETFFLDTELTNRELYLGDDNKAIVNIGFLGQFDFSSLPSKDRIWLTPSNKTERKQSALNVFFDLFKTHYSEDKENLKVLYFSQRNKDNENEYYFILWRANNAEQLNSETYLDEIKSKYKLPYNVQEISLSQNALIPSHIFYIEVSNLSNVEGLYNEIAQRMKEVEASEGEFILYLANGQNPLIAKSSENHDFVTNGILTLTTFTDGTYDFRQLRFLISNLFKEKGKKFYINYYFSNMTNYRTLERKLVTEVFGSREIAQHPIKNVFVEKKNEEGNYTFEKVQ